MANAEINISLRSRMTRDDIVDLIESSIGSDSEFDTGEDFPEGTEIKIIKSLFRHEVTVRKVSSTGLAAKPRAGAVYSANDTSGLTIADNPAYHAPAYKMQWGGSVRPSGSALHVTDSPVDKGNEWEGLWEEEEDSDIDGEDVAFEDDPDVNVVSD